MTLIEQAAKAAYEARREFVTNWCIWSVPWTWEQMPRDNQESWIAVVEAAMKVMDGPLQPGHPHCVRDEEGNLLGAFRSPEDAELFRRAKKESALWNVRLDMDAPSNLVGAYWLMSKVEDPANWDYPDAKPFIPEDDVQPDVMLGGEG